MRYLLSVLVLALAVGVRAEVTPTVPATDQPRATADCGKSKQGWTETETDVWQSLCSTGSADELDEPAMEAYGTPSHHVRGAFLRTLLTESPYREVASKHFNLARMHVDGPLYIADTKIDGDLTLNDLDVPAGITIHNVRVNGNIQLNAICTPHVELSTVEVQGAVWATSSPTIRPDCPAPGLSFGELEVSGRVSLDGFKADFVDLQDTRVGKDINIFLTAKALNFGRLSVNGNLTLQGSDVKSLEMTGVTTAGDVDVSGVLVGDDLQISRSSITGSLNLANTFVQESADVTGTTVAKVLTVGKGGGAEKLRHDPKTGWGPDASLSLVNTTVGTLETSNSIDDWPKTIDLTNFSFSSFIVSEVMQQMHPPVKGPAGPLGEESWFLQWLARANQADAFNPEPYEVVGQYLSKVGQQKAAQEIAIEEKRAERIYACQHRLRWRCMSLWASFAFIGYGFMPWFSLFWVIAFTCVGAVVMMSTPEAKDKRLKYGLAYSFDMFIPLIKLREWHYTIDLKGRARYYFYFHKLMGWVIGSFLAAALAGLTK